MVRTGTDKGFHREIPLILYPITDMKKRSIIRGTPLHLSNPMKMKNNHLRQGRNPTPISPFGTLHQRHIINPIRIKPHYPILKNSPKPRQSIHLSPLRNPNPTTQLSITHHNPTHSPPNNIIIIFSVI
ncbi:MAG: hypothetical protein HDS52_02235 [Barnesiella sp.]|nr:hypothetical protein [Barnesiella sp.]